MTEAAQGQKNYPAPKRLSFPAEETAFAWLSQLLDAYHIADKGVAEGVAAAEQNGQRLACAKGCSACCRSHEDIPVYPLELVGMTWYVVEKLQGPMRQKIKERLQVHEAGAFCPLLVDGACSVHAVRPLACRQFNVFDKPCAEGEDTYHTRRDDVMIPIRSYIDEAFMVMLPFYGVESEAERRKLVETGGVHQLARRLADMNWASLVEKMEAFDHRREQAARP